MRARWQRCARRSDRRDDRRAPGEERDGDAGDSIAGVRRRTEDVIAEGDQVPFRATLTASYDGRRLALRGFGFARIEGGKIVEAYNGWDAQALLSQVTDAPRSLSDVLRYAMK